jgi:hypothetical protein
VSDDFSELYELAADLTDAPERAAKYVEKALKFTSVEMKQDWRQGAERTGLEPYAASIDFDITHGPGEIRSEIGPNIGKAQGSFGFVEDGGGDVQSAPQHAGRSALRANEAGFYRGLEIAVFDATAEAISG